ncbi:MAG: AAA family ATPase [Microcoleus sp. PH2017_10_PVI_O_A]|uniref:P-loop NTPase fold protein n=1 Tax=unclassified Microcoleus TaxID=2642155 RepID=UPI001DEED0D1|nr:MULTISPECIES: P-loop NTPase fold protein [unclassified Microcoleus]TAE84494.1 MAG: ATP-binding protein [Oscillatoriales cyanobacterium]MCC3405159.1 AAA family ATPase [Microcoleus sp. PH2017_10_PVI_O_A]MCC3459245.1 AAA family ATPase [Microcoleus sp. PH2017_11_PCY_U_A]MCC3477439.1 AAA family ATPase [Microcoleus sp. PH2017_12_PCY_D_A]MCC3528699.1 AAA family ATPase [Microcoleus sp. PH2017_21_RUC_O_A]
MTNQRLASFQTAFQNLQLPPLSTAEQLNRFHVEYGTEILEELDHLVEDCSPDDNKIIFTGHRGSGKSTLLGQFCQDTKDRYFVVFFSIADMIGTSEVDHVTILFAMAVQLMEAAEKRQIKIGSKTKKAFYQWLDEHTRTEETSFESGMELETSGEAGVNALFVKFFAKLKATLKANSVIREEITTKFERRISELIDRINDIAVAIQAGCRQEVLVVIDDLDKLDLETVNRVYRNNINALFQPQFRIIYTIPMAATRDLSLRGIIQNATKNKIQSMWATKLFPRGEDRVANASPVAEAVKVFEQILYKRIPKELIAPEATQMMIVKSGGALREFIRLASLCCGLCLKQLRRTPDKQDLIITPEILENAIKDYRINLTEPLGQNRYQILVDVYQNYLPKDGMDQDFLDLLHTLYILEYRNDDLWFGVHPVVQEILQRRGLIGAEG